MAHLATVLIVKVPVRIMVALLPGIRRIILPLTVPITGAVFILPTALITYPLSYSGINHKRYITGGISRGYLYH